MLDQVADRVTALVFAPPDLAERFDEHGCIRPDKWLTHKISLSEEQIEIVDDAGEQAQAVIRAMAQFGGRYSTEEISVGVPDVQLVPYLEQRLGQSGLPARYAAGTPMARSAPCRLLAAVADYLETSGFSAFAALVRHPSVHDWLAGQGISGDWLGQMDRYHAEYMPYRLDGQWKGDHARRSTLEPVYGAIEELCRPLRGRPRPLAQWGQPILDLLIGVWGAAALDPDAEPDRTVLAACGAIRDVLEEHLAVPAGLVPSLGSAEAMRLVLGQACRGDDRRRAELRGHRAVGLAGTAPGRRPGPGRHRLQRGPRARPRSTPTCSCRTSCAGRWASRTTTAATPATPMPCSLLAASQAGVAADRRPAQRRGRPPAAQPAAVRLRRSGDRHAG